MSFQQKNKIVNESFNFQINIQNVKIQLLPVDGVIFNILQLLVIELHLSHIQEKKKLSRNPNKMHIVLISNVILLINNNFDSI